MASEPTLKIGSTVTGVYKASGQLISCDEHTFRLMLREYVGKHQTATKAVAALTVAPTVFLTAVTTTFKSSFGLKAEALETIAYAVAIVAFVIGIFNLIKLLVKMPVEDDFVTILRGQPLPGGIGSVWKRAWLGFMKDTGAS